MSTYGLLMAAPPAHFTHPRLQIRTAHDAHRVFEAVRRGLLPLIRRRLSPSERDLLSSGQVFVWEEAPTGSAAGDETSQTTSGLERWTDGRRWSQSRMREPFLFYEEKVQTTPEEKQAKADRRARKASSTSDSQAALATLQPVRRQDRPTKPDGLTKQTYSSYVYFPSTSPTTGSPTTPPQPRKWHCVAYFSAADWNILPGIEAYPELNSIIVPDGVYVSTKGTGKTGAPPPSALASSSTTSNPNANVFPPIASSPVSYYDGNCGVGPIRRPHSRGEHSLSPYPTSGASPSPCSTTSTSSSASAFGSPSSVTPKGRANSFGEGRYRSPSTSSYSPRTSYEARPSFGSLPPPPARSSSYSHTYSSTSTTPGASMAAAVAGVYGSHNSLLQHHQHSSSTSSSSASTSSPPTPGFGAPIPSPNGFRRSLDGDEERRRSRRDDVDTVMYDAPTLRTPTKEFPSRTRSASRTGEYFSTSQPNPPPSVQPSESTPSSSGTTPGGTVLPSLPSLLGQNWQTSGRSREDSRALGAFRLAL